MPFLNTSRLTPECGRVFPTPSNSPIFCRNQLDALQCNSPDTVRWGQHISHKGLSTPGLHTHPLSRRQLQVQLVTCASRQLTINQIPITPSPSDNLLEWLTGLSKRFTRLPVYYKRIQLRTATWKRCTGQAVWEGARDFYAVSSKPQSQQSVFTNREALQTLHFKDLYVGMTDYITGHW